MPIKEIGPFSVTYLQVLDEKGNVDPDLDPELPEEKLIELYRGMVLSRAADERLLKLQRQGRAGTFAPGIGQEATAVGSAVAMTERDWFAGSFRELGSLLVRGMPLWKHFLYYNGYEEGNLFAESGRTLPITIIVGSQTLHAVGLAYAMRFKGENDSAVLTVFGDGGSSQGDVHEAMNFASVWQAPVVFLCQNNQWAISVPLRKQARSRTLAQRAIGYDMPGVQVDGNDVLAVYRAVNEALERARKGQGPTFIEAVTYRLVMHTTSDDPRKYRTEEEEKEWWPREPIGRFRTYLEKKGIWDEVKQAQLEKEIKTEIEEAVRLLETPREFKPDLPFDHVFGTRHPVIEAQRAEFLESLVREKEHAKAEHGAGH
jgi:pyruvate dehydrogenase E1 component alpha subunit